MIGKRQRNKLVPDHIDHAGLLSTGPRTSTVFARVPYRFEVILPAKNVSNIALEPYN